MQNLVSAAPADKPDSGLMALDSALQEQERIITMSYALASEASLKSKLVAGQSFAYPLNVFHSLEPFGNVCSYIFAFQGSVKPAL